MCPNPARWAGLYYVGLSGLRIAAEADLPGRRRAMTGFATGVEFAIRVRPRSGYLRERGILWVGCQPIDQSEDEDTHGDESI